LAQRIYSLLALLELPRPEQEAEATVALAKRTMAHTHLARAGPPGSKCADAAGAHHGRLDTRRGRRRRGAASAASDGPPCELATHGIEAIECLERQPCEVVLIDVQMTDMDGLEASRINERWRNGGRTRIISMIANATQRDRGECLAAGMEDHVNQPNRVDHLIASLVRT
jgi:CheY-like chemotaxis protein